MHLSNPPDLATLSTLPFPVVIRRSMRAKRCFIRIKPLPGHQVELVLPPRLSLEKAWPFLLSKQQWIERILAKHPPMVTIRDGVTIPLLGQDITIRHCERAKSCAWLEPGYLMVSGPLASLKKTVQLFLKTVLHQCIRQLIESIGSTLCKKPVKIRIGDYDSKWGSCSHNGTLSFSWRLMFAPTHVLQYIIAHELAHLEVMNHSPAFWKTVKRLYPDYESGKTWLKTNGSSLYRYSFS